MTRVLDHTTRLSIARPAATADTPPIGRVPRPRDRQPDHVITIGRSVENTIVLPETNVSKFHATITLTADKAILEDLGSTNGTAVGRMENKIDRAVIRADDVIFFGSTSYLAADLIAAGTASRKSHSNVSDVSDRAEVSRFPAGSILVITGVIAAALLALAITLVLATVLVLSRVRPRDSEPAVERGSQSASREPVASQMPPAANQPAKIASPRPSAVRPASAKKQPAADAGPTQPSMSRLQPATQPLVRENPPLKPAAATDQRPTPEDAVYLIVGSRDGKTLNRGHVAVAIGPNQLITTASVALLVEDSRTTGNWKFWLVHPKLKSVRIEFDLRRIHPQYQPARQATFAAARDLDSVLPRRGVNQSLSLPEQRNIAAAWSRFRQSTVQQAMVDVAVLETGRTLNHYLRIANHSRRIDASTLRVIGYPDSPTPLNLQSIPPVCTWQFAGVPVQRNNIREPNRLMAKELRRQANTDLTACPILNEKDEVVALVAAFSARADAIGIPSQEPDSIDVVLHDRIRDVVSRHEVE